MLFFFYFVTFLFCVFSEAGGDVEEELEFLSIKENEKVTVIRKREETKWWTGVVDGKKGLFNIEYLEASVVALLHKKPEEKMTVNDGSICPNLLVVTFFYHFFLFIMNSQNINNSFLHRILT